MADRANQIRSQERRLTYWSPALVLAVASAFLLSPSASSAAPDEGQASYEAALEKLATSGDGDPYAAERLKYVAAKVRRGERRCRDRECREAREQDVLTITQAILMTDPSSAVWRDLKLCETAECAISLVPSLARSDAADHAVDPNASHFAGSQASPQPDESAEAEGEAPAVGPTPTEVQDATVSESSVTELPAAKTSSPDTPTNWMPLAGVGGLLAGAFWFFARRKCPLCKRRGTSVRAARNLVGQTQGQRMKQMQSRTVHRGRDSEGHLLPEQESVTTYQVPVSTVTEHYVDEYHCKNCGHDYSVRASSTHDA